MTLRFPALHRSACLLVCVFVSLVVGTTGCRCGDDKARDDTQASAPGEPSGETRDQDQAHAPTLEVTLLEAGQEPRRSLRLAAQVGDVEEVTLSAWGTQTERSDDEPPTSEEVPRATLLCELRVREVNAIGDRLYDVTITTVPTRRIQARSLAQGAMRVSERSVPLDMELELISAEELTRWLTDLDLDLDIDLDLDDGPGGSDDDQEARLTGPVGIAPQSTVPDDPMAPENNARLSTAARTLVWIPEHLVPYPEQAVGKGARWRTSGPLAGAMAAVIYVTEYEVLEMTDDGATLRATTSYRGKPSVPWISGLSVQAFEGGASGEVTVSRRRVLPRVRETSESRMSMRFADAPGESDATSGVTLELTMERRIAPFGQLESELFPLAQIASPPTTRWARPDFCATSSGARDGRFASTFHEDGSPALVGACRAGAYEGEWTWYHADGGGRAMHGPFADGLAHGRFTQWDEAGQEIGAFEMQRGTGVVTHAWENGEVRVRAAFADGLPHGAFETFYPDGARHMRGAHESGTPAGPWQAWDEAGTLVSSWLFDRHCRIVHTVFPDTPAARAGLEPGDLIVAIGDDSLERPEGVRLAVEANGTRPVRMRIRRGEAERVETMIPEAGPGEPPRIGVALVCARPH